MQNSCNLLKTSNSTLHSDELFANTNFGLWKPEPSSQSELSPLLKVQMIHVTCIVKSTWALLQAIKVCSRNRKENGGEGAAPAQSVLEWHTAHEDEATIMAIKSIPSATNVCQQISTWKNKTYAADSRETLEELHTYKSIFQKGIQLSRIHVRHYTAR